MKRFLPLILVIGVIAFSGCASKRLAKRGLKFEQAGMYEMAADMYYQAVVANPKNVDAVVGLKKNGQRLLDDKSMQVQKAYLSNNDRETVYSYVDAKKYLDKVNATGVSFNLSESSRGYYEEAKPRYLEALFYDARLLLEEERFRESESKFAEIKRIEPNYEGVDEYMKVSQSEPLYRRGIDNMKAGLPRMAYHNFSEIIVKHGLYKDTKDLRDEALKKAQITIAIGSIENRTKNRNANLLVESSINSALSNLNNPFIKIVDLKNTQQFIDQQAQGVSYGADIKVGEILSAKAILNGSVIRFDVSEGKSESENKRGYIREIITTKDKKTGEEKKETKYHKIAYIEVTRENSSFISVQYQLSSTETGVVLVSDAININKTDEIHFATFNGNSKNMVPGYWEYSDKKSPKDRIDDNATAVRQLQQLFSAKQTITSAEGLKNEALSELATRVAQKINKYNPED